MSTDALPARHTDAATVGRRAVILPVRLENVCLRRGGQALLDAVTLDLEPSGLTVVMGPNGAGKSLLLRVLAGLVQPDSGHVRWRGSAPTRNRALRVALVFQSPVMLRRTTRDNLIFALSAANVPRALRPAKARALLEQADLLALADRPARRLSGGEQQRLALVRALATQPELLLLDEPTANLDPSATEAVEHLARTIYQQGTKVVMVTHDLGQAQRVADDVTFMHGGQVVERSPAGTFFAQPQHRASQAFIEGRLFV